MKVSRGKEAAMQSGGRVARVSGVALALCAAAGWMAAPEAAPGQATATRLPWVHEGLVLTYTWYAAVTAGNGSYYEENEHGDWVLHSTGQRYTRQMQTGTSGNGWSQITVACIDGEKVVLESRSYADAGSLGRNAPVPQGTTSSVNKLADPGDYWMDPAKLASMHTAPAENLLVTRVAWTTGGKTVDAVRAQRIRPPEYSDHVYDAKTGLCLHVASSSEGAPAKLVGPGDTGRGDTTITRNDFVSARDIAVPWAKEAAPEWVGSLRALHHRGSIISRGPLPTVPNVLAMDLEVQARGRGWLQVSGRSSQQMQGAPSPMGGRISLAFGASQWDGLWIGPAALAQLRAGQVLDEDPVTRMRTVVAQSDDARVVIAMSNAAGEIDNQYDKRTGMLTASSFYDVLSLQQKTLKLQSKE